MTVLWHLLLYWYIQQVIHPRKASHHNPKVTSISWPLLINHKIIPIQGKQNIMGGNADEDADTIEVPVAMEMEETLITGMIIKIEVPDVVKDNGTFNTIEGEGKTTHTEVDEDNGMKMTSITVTETTGIEIPKIKVILTGVEDGIILIEVKDIVIGVEGEDGIPISTIMIQGINNKPNFQTQIIIVHHPIPYEQYSYPQQQQQQYQPSMPPAPSQQATNMCQLCHNQGHYDYQCQFAGDFMACTQKAFSQGRSYSHQDPNHGVWSHGDNDDNDPNGQSFQ